MIRTTSPIRAFRIRRDTCPLRTVAERPESRPANAEKFAPLPLAPLTAVRPVTAWRPCDDGHNP